MQEPFIFYNEQLTTYSDKLSNINRQLFASSMIRLAVFLLAIFGIYIFYGQTNPIIAIAVLTFVLFLFLVSRHTDLQLKRDKLMALVRINETEMEVLNRKFDLLTDGAEFQNPGHWYSQDIDLFGRGSFYQYCNRTCLQPGRWMLADILTSNDIEMIPDKQEAIKELAAIPEWRQDFSANAMLVNTNTSNASIFQWIKAYTPFVADNVAYVPRLFSMLSALIITSYFLDAISGWILAGWFFLGLGITGKYLKKINKLSSDTSEIQSSFRQYQALLINLEERSFESALLRNRADTVLQKGEKTSEVLKRFSRLLSALDQRNNMVIGLLGNAFMLRDIHLSGAIEQWIALHGPRIESWFNTIAFFDTYNSLGNFSFNHPDYTYPEIVNGDTILKTVGASHPMLDPEKRVANDFEVREARFFVITGANMAGKSTFLRTVSLHIVMANAGLPVCAVEATYKPIKLITSMRTTDSLTDDESYFYSELKRLKFIVDHIETDHYFIVLDEILKGTNSIDKSIGSRKFVEKLIASKSTGIIATHDLSVCKSADEHPEIENFYFDVEIINDELYFDYTLKQGVCKNMNASYLLDKMGIV